MLEVMLFIIQYIYIFVYAFVGNVSQNESSLHGYESFKVEKQFAVMLFYT